MGWEAWFSFAVLVSVFAGLAVNIAPDALLVGAVVVFALVGVITPEDAFHGFSNTGMLTVGALYVVAAGLRETGTLSQIGSWVLGRARTERGAMVRMALSVTGMSAFLNNTPIVSMFIPIVQEWCKRRQVSPSRLLLPLSYFCILGGTCTLIGTSTNLVVNGLMSDAVARDPGLSETLRPMRLFELSYVGVPYAIIGVAYMLWLGRRLLPDREGFLERLSQRSREYLVNLRVEEGCSIAGKGVEEAGLRHLPGLFLIEIQRQGDIIAPVTPDQKLRVGDVLTFTGVVSTIVDLERIKGLSPVADASYATVSLQQRDQVLCEAVVSGVSPVLGKTVRDADFRARYNAAIVAVHRGGVRLHGRVGDIVLRPGDTLLLQAGPHFLRANRNNPDFLLVGGIEDARPFRYDKAAISLGLLALLLILMASGVVEIVMAAFLVAGLMLLTRCISVADARQSVDWRTLVTIGAAFGVGKALMGSGFVEIIAEYTVASMGHWGPYAVLAGIYLLTGVFTELITNNAAAALVFPFALAIAERSGFSPRPLVMAITFAASASFITPIGYQTNLMVFGPGGYKFSDFFRVGMPLHLVLFLAAVVLIPLVWPF